MADTAVAITAGTGTNIDTRTEGTNGNHRQVIVVGDPNTNAGVAPVDATNGLSVNVTNASLTVASHAVTDGGGSLTVDNAGTFATQVTSIAAGNNNIGDVDVASLPALPAGTNNIGDVDVLTIGGQTPAFGSGANGATVLRVGLATDSPGVIGTGTAGTPASNVITMQGISAMTPVTTQLAEGSNMVSGAITTAMTGTTSTSLVAAPGASLRNYITTIIVSNSHATVGTDVIIQDGSGGTTLMTIPAAAVYGGAVITLPTPLRQPTTNTALFCANVTTGASTKVSAVGYKAA